MQCKLNVVYTCFVFALPYMLHIESVCGILLCPLKAVWVLQCAYFGGAVDAEAGAETVGGDNMKKSMADINSVASSSNACTGFMYTYAYACMHTYSITTSGSYTTSCLNVLQSLCMHRVHFSRQFTTVYTYMPCHACMHLVRCQFSYFKQYTHQHHHDASLSTCICIHCSPFPPPPNFATNSTATLPYYPPRTWWWWCWCSGCFFVDIYFCCYSIRRSLECEFI